MRRRPVPGAHGQPRRANAWSVLPFVPASLGLHATAACCGREHGWLLLRAAMINAIHITPSL
jgi:hypothetical protein